MSLATTNSLDLLKTIAPQHIDRGDDVLGIYIDLAAQSVSASAYRALYKQAVVYLAAHLLEMDARNADGLGGGGTGPIIGKRAGEVSINYGFSGASLQAGAIGALSSTPYGVRFLAIRRSLAAGKPLSTADLDWKQ